MSKSPSGLDSRDVANALYGLRQLWHYRKTIDRDIESIGLHSNWDQSNGWNEQRWGRQRWFSKPRRLHWLRWTISVVDDVNIFDRLIPVERFRIGLSIHSVETAGKVLRGRQRHRRHQVHRRSVEIESPTTHDPPLFHDMSVRYSVHFFGLVWVCFVLV